MKSLLCSLLALLLLAGPTSFGKTPVTQQKEDNEILAQGSPPLTIGLVDKLVEFFEWSLESKFTKSQRTVFTTRLIQVWEKPLQPLIDGLIQARKGYEALANVRNEDRTKAQSEIQAILREGFADDPPGSLGELLRSVYASSHPNAPPVARNQQAPLNKPGGMTRVPSELVGEWLARGGSGSSYYNPRTGQTSAPNATIDSYKIFADGTYEHSLLMQSSLYNCTTTIFGRETGPIVVQGSTFTITPAPGTLDYKSSCSPSLNSLKQTNFAPETLSWRLERGEYGLQLCLQKASGASGCYLKQ